MVTCPNTVGQDFHPYIVEYFQAHKSLAERTEFLKNSYKDIWVEVLTDGVRTGYHAEKDGLLMLSLIHI